MTVPIVKSINKITEDEKENKYKNLFDKSINYDYKDIEKELRDRLTFKKSNNNNNKDTELKDRKEVIKK